MTCRNIVNTNIIYINKWKMYIIFRHTTSFAENLFKNEMTILKLDNSIIL